MASSPASKPRSRTIVLKPLWADLGPQNSNVKSSDWIAPLRSACVIADSARLVFNVRGADATEVMIVQMGVLDQRVQGRRTESPEPCASESVPGRRCSPAEH